MDFLDPSKLPAVIAALAPGFLVMFVRRQFVVGKPPSFQDRAVTYAAISAIYFAAAIPLFGYLKTQWIWSVEWWNFAQYFALPIIVGLLLTLLTTNRSFDRAWQFIGLQPIHHIPSAWDYMFGSLKSESWIIVTLNNGDQVAGKYDRGSFASSDGGERDMLISDMWTIPETGPWTRLNPPRSILLCGRDIRSIEILRAEGTNNERSEATDDTSG